MRTNLSFLQRPKDTIYIRQGHTSAQRSSGMEDEQNCNSKQSTQLRPTSAQEYINRWGAYDCWKSSCCVYIYSLTGHSPLTTWNTRTSCAMPWKQWPLSSRIWSPTRSRPSASATVPCVSVWDGGVLGVKSDTVYLFVSLLPSLLSLSLLFRHGD